MRTFLEPLLDLQVFAELKQKAGTGGEPLAVYGCIDAQKPHLMYALGTDRKRKLIITYSEKRAREIIESYRFFQGGAQEGAAFFPSKDFLFYQSDVRGGAIEKERLQAIRTILERRDAVVVTTSDTLLDKVAAPRLVREAVLTFAAGETLDLEETRKTLTAMGYESAYQAEMPGQFAVRGGILDIYPLTDELPVRIELWGDEIDSIRSYRPDSQRSEDTLEIAEVYPARDLILTQEQLERGLAVLKKDGKQLYERYRKEMKTEEAANIRQQVDFVSEQIADLHSMDGVEGYLPYFFSDHPEDLVSLQDYFAEDALIFVDEPLRCAENARKTLEEFQTGMERRLSMGYLLPGQMDLLWDTKETEAALAEKGAIGLSALEGTAPGFERAGRFSFTVRPVESYNNSFPLLVKDLQYYKKNRYRVVLVCRSQTRAQHMAKDFLEEGLTAFYSPDKDRILQPGELMVTYGSLSAGFSYPDCQFVVLTESDIFGGTRKKRKRRKKYEGKNIQSFTDLNPGDYVVHENHGLGIYRGIEKVEMNHKVKDYMKIEYAGGGFLYVLATQMDLIQKYAGSGAKPPRLSSLGSTEWKKTRNRVKKAVGEIAKELVDLYAARQKEQGYKYPPDTLMQREFEEMFPYEETDDQLHAIADAKADMEEGKVMDRLICGDVGFGKTEVALRIAFKTVQESRQVVYLVPTTILAQQHYNTFVQRLRDFPVDVELLCRFRTPAQQKETIKKLKDGRADIVIGTHRVLSKDVQFKNLGLLIIDEEQRFGVSHKEHIKQLRKNVDVLSLTATPIPRTLHMSLIGIRDMSVLEEPPRDRMPVQTYVMEYNEEMVREAIERELARNGQVFYVFNSVRGVPELASRISKLVPEASVAYAHGQMPERQLEDIMYSFINHEIDVLVTTTIIETGMDIANANTMIIQDADRMGLSQLYQLRGRIGRSSRIAYAFLMYRRNKILKEEAGKRLTAIRNFTELGSGFKIAMKDLEIRGAGNLLGEAQSGHMEAVGYDLYCKMLNEAVHEAKNDKPAEEHFETSVDLQVNAYIPSSYIRDEQQRLDLYKRIAAIQSEQDKDDILDELIDRFGEPSRSVQNLLTIALLKVKAHAAGFSEVTESQQSLRLIFFERADINAAGIPDLVQKYRGRLKFTADAKKPSFTYLKKKTDKNTLLLLQDLLKDCGEYLGKH